MQVNQNHKVILLGEASVGKTSILQYILTGEFNEHCPSTLGVNYQEIKVPTEYGRMTLQIWDTAGQEKYQGLTKMYYRQTDVALIVYDITSQDSFNKAKKWYTELKEQNNTNSMVILLGNRSDLEQHRKVATSMGRNFAALNNLYFYETSAKTGDNIDEVVHFIITTLPKIKKENLENLALALQTQRDISKLMITIQEEKAQIGSGSPDSLTKLKDLTTILNKTGYAWQVQSLPSEELYQKYLDTVEEIHSYSPQQILIKPIKPNQFSSCNCRFC
ncbi:hypothetical protein WA158_002314 [Blastocystis sp. Blastoise]